MLEFVSYALQVSGVATSYRIRHCWCLRSLEILCGKLDSSVDGREARHLVGWRMDKGDGPITGENSVCGRDEG